MLKPVKVEKIFREIKILQTLYGGTNIIKLCDMVQEPASQTPCFIYEYMPCGETKIIARGFNDLDVRIYLYQVLEALDFSHSHGIMHRDVKPLNIVINEQTKELRLIDWGLADFYFPEKEYNVRVASRYYKGPELLVDDKLYHYSLDIWSLGCTMAGMIFKVDTFFKGSDNFDQLVKIIKVLGEDELHEYLYRYGLKLPKEVRKAIKDHDYQRVPFTAFINDNNKHMVSPEAIDLLEKLLKYDKNERVNCKEAMNHKYFEPAKAWFAANRKV